VTEESDRDDNGIPGITVKPGILRVAHWLYERQRAPGSVKLRTGGESPRPVRSQRPADPVESRDRRLKSGWEAARRRPPRGGPPKARTHAHPPEPGRQMGF
jgi:hypothetical protein